MLIVVWHRFNKLREFYWFLSLWIAYNFGQLWKLLLDKKDPNRIMVSVDYFAGNS